MADTRRPAADPLSLRGGGGEEGLSHERPWRRSEAAARKFASFIWPLTSVSEVRRLLATRHISPLLLQWQEPPLQRGRCARLPPSWWGHRKLFDTYSLQGSTRACSSGTGVTRFGLRLLGPLACAKSCCGS